MKINLEDKLLSVAAPAVGGDVSKVDELAVVPLHHNARPPQLPPPSPPPRLSPRSLLSPDSLSPQLSPSSHHLSSSPRFCLNDSDDDCKENSADDSDPHGSDVVMVMLLVVLVCVVSLC